MLYASVKWGSGLPMSMNDGQMYKLSYPLENIKYVDIIISLVP